MKVVVVGGAGFIGSNVAQFYLERGDEVVVIDNLSRKGAEANLAWLQSLGEITFQKEDVRDYARLKEVFAGCGEIDLVCHLAGQVAVTTSVLDPRTDFEVNALGTFNVLEAVRENKQDPVIIFASTNKVYGEMIGVEVEEQETKYCYASMPKGVSETFQLDFHSPYGCSKGTADQYILDYSRIYGLKTVCMRQSCIYGPRQFGVEDQGWVAWFIIATVLGKDITIYGDGKQVRDILHVHDLVELYQAAYENIDRVNGMAFNVGGGSDNQLSLIEFFALLEKQSGKNISLAYDDWRPGDQKIYVSDIAKARKMLKWSPKIDAKQGIAMLWEWVEQNKEIF